MSKVINAVKDGYLWLVDYVDDHPQASVWIFVGVAVLLLVLR